MNNILVNAFHHILVFYFGNVERETILTLAGVEEEDFSLSDVMLVAKESNLVASSHTIKPMELDSFLFPVIVKNSRNEYLVIEHFKRDIAVVFDPQTQERKEINKKKLRAYTEGIFFFRNERDKSLTSRTKTLSWFTSPLKAVWRSYLEVGIISLFINIFALALPLFTMSIYDRVIPNFATETLYVLVGGVLIIFVFEMILKSARVYILENSGKKVGSYLEESLLERMLQVQTQYDQLLSGTKANLFRELQQVKEFFTSRTMVQILDLPFFIIAVLTIYIISPTLALIPLVAGVILITFNLIMQFPLANLAHFQFKESQNKYGYLVETIQGRDALKLINASSQRLFNWRRLVAQHESLGEKMQVLQHFASNSSYIIIQGVTLFVVFLGVFEVHDKHLSIGGLIAVTILSSRAMVPIVNLSGVLLHFKKVKESLASINEYWHLPREVGDKTQLGIGKLEGKIEFMNTSYFYNSSKYPSLDNVTLTINPGEKVGIIGQTGAGKSTLLRLISVLDLPSSGSVFIDSHETSTLHPVEVRQNIGVMPQSPFMFSGTIKENIALNRPIGKEELAKLIDMTGLDALIKKSGQGDALQVGENGENLSVGQRHLVALARALVGEPNILVLDEPTTGLDVGLERNVVNRLKSIVADKTLLVITHRFSALDLVDRVLVVENGKVVADGPKEKILAMLGVKS